MFTSATQQQKPFNLSLKYIFLKCTEQQPKNLCSLYSYNIVTKCSNSHCDINSAYIPPTENSSAEEFYCALTVSNNIQTQKPCLQ